MSRKEKTEDLMQKHLPIFRKKGVTDPFFTLKCAYFISGKKGKYIQLFESELAKEKDIYTEFVKKDLTPDLDDRPLFKLTYNPFYKEEFEIENKVTDEGKEYSVYIIPIVDMRVILPNGNEISYSDYENGNIPTSPFPNFEEEFGSKKRTMTTSEEEPVSDILMRMSRDFEKLAEALSKFN
jgi:hypothetical protein